MHDSLVSDEFVAALVAATLDAVPHPVLVTDYEKFVYVNRPAYRFLGARSSAEIFERRALDFIHPDSRAAVDERRAVIVDGHQPISGAPLKLLKVDGGSVVATVDLAPVDYNGRSCELNLIRTVLPPAHPLDDTPLESADPVTNAHVFEAMPFCMLIHDEKRILAANAACRRILGAVSDDELVGRPLEAIVHPDGRSAGEARRSMMCQHGVQTLSRVAVKLRRLDGRDIHIDVDAQILAVDHRTAFLVTTHGAQVTAAGARPGRYSAGISVLPPR